MIIQCKMCTKEKILSSKKKILETVESLLEESVSEENLISASRKLSQADYGDVIEERNILNYCGYPLCLKKIKVPSQKYHISFHEKKVYDISERKCFCSNLCYKASNFLKSQLPVSPIWLQEEPVTVTLLERHKNRGCAGTEIPLCEKVHTGDINPEVEDNRFYDQREKLLLNEIAYCAEEFEKRLIVKESVPTCEPTLHCGIGVATNYGSFNLDLSESSSISCFVSSVENGSKSLYSGDRENCLSTLQNFEDCLIRDISTTTTKTMHSSAVLIAPLPEKKINSSALTINSAFLTDVHRIFKEWITTATHEFLLNDIKFSVNTKEIEKSGNISNEYAKQLSVMSRDCIRFSDKLENIEENELGENVISRTVLKHVENDSTTKKLDAREKAATYFHSKNSSPDCDNKAGMQKQIHRAKKKKAAVEQKELKQLKETTSPGSHNAWDCYNMKTEVCSLTEERVLPNVDSLSQDVLRQQLMISKLRSVYLDILPLAGLHYSDISEDIRQLTSTFRLSPTNVIFHPAEWKIVALIIFRMLKPKLPHNVCDDHLYQILLEKSCISKSFTMEYADWLIMAVFDAQKHALHLNN